jgi:N-acetylneuraminate lyase
MQVFKGILPAVVTPLDAQERFNRSIFERLAERLYESGVDGLYVCGQTGEGMLQSVAQRKQVTDAAVACSPRGKLVVIHVGAASTADAVELARHAGTAGAHAISSLPPAGNYSYDEVRTYYEELGASSDIPLLIYYFPSVCPGIRTIEQMLDLCTIPNVAGLKFTDSDLYRLWRLRRSGAVVFNGSDEMLVAGLLMGANGGIGSIYNLVPDQFVHLYQLTAAGKWDQARSVQDSINELIQAILHFPVNPAVKALLEWSGLPCGNCIAPRTKLTQADREKLRSMVAKTTYSDRFLTGVAG